MDYNEIVGNHKQFEMGLKSVTWQMCIFFLLEFHIVRNHKTHPRSLYDTCFMFLEIKH
jgi:hypothetical protein